MAKNTFLLSLCRECFLPLDPPAPHELNPYLVALGYHCTGKVIHENCFWRMANLNGWTQRVGQNIRKEEAGVDKDHGKWLYREEHGK